MSVASASDLLQQSLAANQTHQLALTKYAEKLTEELKEIDALLARFSVLIRHFNEDDQLDHDIQIPGSITAKSPINPTDLLKSESPFYEEATKRQRYVNFINARPMKAKELDALVEAVKNEFRRLKAIEHRERGLDIPSRDEPVDMNGDTKDIDWRIVAEKVSDVSSIKRTPEECRVKWLGHKQPRLNHSEWKEQELARLHAIVKDRQSKGRVDWVEVARALGTNRVPIDCMKNGLQRPKHNWNDESDKKLLEAVQLYGLNNWGLCALHVSEHCSASQCQTHYIRVVDPKLTRVDWTPEEDAKLLAAVTTFGTSWVDVCAFVPGRSNDQCRERYQTALLNVTGRKGGLWSPDEDAKLLEGFNLHGNKWKLVSAHMNGTRSDTQCRTRFVKLQQKASSARESSSAASSRMPSVAPTSTPSDQVSSASTPQPGSANYVLNLYPPDPSASSAPSSQPPPRRNVKGKEKAVAPEDSGDITPSNTDVEISSTAKGKGKARPKPRPVPKRKAASESEPLTAMDVDAESPTTKPRPKPKSIPKRKADRNANGGDIAMQDPEMTGQTSSASAIAAGENPQEHMEVDPLPTPTPAVPTRKRGRPRKSELQPLPPDEGASAPLPQAPVSTPAVPAMEGRATRQSTRLSAKRAAGAP
uniref:Uncharacterized protein n=1 Tax=Moniliophthora roreri TaxID=221103 RepID=A0A0W0FCB9_MONRR